MSKEESSANPELDKVVIVDLSPEKRKLDQNPELAESDKVCNPSPKKRKLDENPELASHIQSALASIMNDETHERKSPKKVRRPQSQSQKLPIEFFDGLYLQIAPRTNRMRMNKFDPKKLKYVYCEMPLASFLMGYWQGINQVEPKSREKMDEILARLIFSMKAGLAKIDMDMVGGQLWATIRINDTYEFMWDVTDNFLVLCQKPDGELQFYSFLHTTYLDNESTNPYFEINFKKYTPPPPVIAPIYHFMDMFLPKP